VIVWGMTIIDGRTWMEHLSTETCWELLETTPVGRVVVTVQGAPEIYPVNFVVDDRSVAFRTAPGSKLSGLERFPTTCFEADVIDPERRAGWSVMVKGQAVDVIPARRALASELDAAHALDGRGEGPLGPHPPDRGHRPTHPHDRHP
jgi:uncharacterized protein